MSDTSFIKIGVRRATHKKYSRLKRRLRLSYVELADLAADALARCTHEQLQDLKSAVHTSADPTPQN